MTNPPIKKYSIYCEPCGTKKILTEEEVKQLPLIKSSDIQRKIPKLDPVTKKTKTHPTKSQPKKTKCPNCGRGVIIKGLPEVFAKAYKEIEEQERAAQQKRDFEQRLEDGKPIEREVDPDYEKEN